MLLYTVYTETFARRKFPPIYKFCKCMPLLKIFLHSENFDTLNFACVIMSAHTYAHSTHTNNSRAPPTTSWKVAHVIGEICVPIQPLAKILASENFVIYYGTYFVGLN